MSSSSDSETGSDKEEASRLGDCEVCAVNKAVYTCPKCEVKTCCLSCVRIHKKELECDGIRDRTKFIRMKDFNDTDLLSDYRLLEECARFVYAVKRDEKKKFTRIDKDLPVHLFKLKMAARKRGTVLQFLSRNFTRHSLNTTRFNFRTNIIYWRVEWIFPNVETTPLKFVDEKCSEHGRLSHLLDKYLNLDASPFEGSKSLAYYKSAGFSGVKILLKDTVSIQIIGHKIESTAYLGPVFSKMPLDHQKFEVVILNNCVIETKNLPNTYNTEKVKRSAKKFFELDPSETLSENLSGKCIVEFPIIFVVLKDHAYNFEIITPEDEFGYENDDKASCVKDIIKNETDKTRSTNSLNLNSNVNENTKDKLQSSKRPKILLTEKIAEQKKRAIEEEIKEERKKRPKNLLFTTGYSSEESLESDSDKDT